jgi:heme-degrading monooxygenase HmoA
MGSRGATELSVLSSTTGIRKVAISQGEREHMVTEIAQFTAVAGKAEELLAGLRRAMRIIRGAEGNQGITLRRCIEDPNSFIYEIQWATLEDHTVTFRGGPLFAQYRGYITGLFVEPVAVRHYETVTSE